jgi:hypothetical protein
MKMIKVFVNDDQFDVHKVYDEDLAYILDQDKIYLRKKIGIVDAVVPVNKMQLFNTGKKIKPKAKLNIPKIQKEDFATIFQFFKKVYQTNKSESIVRIYHDEKTNKFHYYCMEQYATSTMLKTKKINMQDEIVKKYNHIGDLHSHGNMSAFHSHTDISDEDKFTGIHFTIGNVLSDDFTVSVEISVNGFRISVDPMDYIENLQKSKKESCYNFNQTNIIIDEEKIQNWLSKIQTKPPKQKFYYHSKTNQNKINKYLNDRFNSNFFTCEQCQRNYIITPINYCEFCNRNPKNEQYLMMRQDELVDNFVLNDDDYDNDNYDDCDYNDIDWMDDEDKEKINNAIQFILEKIGFMNLIKVVWNILNKK